MSLVLITQIGLVTTVLEAPATMEDQKFITIWFFTRSCVSRRQNLGPCVSVAAGHT